MATNPDKAAAVDGLRAEARRLLRRVSEVRASASFDQPDLWEGQFWKMRALSQNVGYLLCAMVREGVSPEWCAGWTAPTTPRSAVGSLVGYGRVAAVLSLDADVVTSVADPSNEQSPFGQVIGFDLDADDLPTAEEVSRSHSLQVLDVLEAVLDGIAETPAARLVSAVPVDDAFGVGAEWLLNAMKVRGPMRSANILSDLSAGGADVPGRIQALFDYCKREKLVEPEKHRTKKVRRTVRATKTAIVRRAWIVSEKGKEFLRSRARE